MGIDGPILVPLHESVHDYTIVSGNTAAEQHPQHPTRLSPSELEVVGAGYHALTGKHEPHIRQLLQTMEERMDLLSLGGIRGIFLPQNDHSHLSKSRA